MRADRRSRRLARDLKLDPAVLDARPPRPRPADPDLEALVAAAEASWPATGARP